MILATIQAYDDQPVLTLAYDPATYILSATSADGSVAEDVGPLFPVVEEAISYIYDSYYLGWNLTWNENAASF